jgi:hypothetical protein
MALLQYTARLRFLMSLFKRILALWPYALILISVLAHGRAFVSTQVESFPAPTQIRR